MSAHPAFPAIVALWFAALFGIGSLVLPAALFERAFEATGIASLFTAAQAPLGVSARISIALVAALLGVVAGLSIARQVVAASAPKPVSRRAAQLNPATNVEGPAAKRPISAHEELGQGGIDAELDADAARDAITGRRRALAVTDESARSDFLEFAPLPGQDDRYGTDDDGTALDLAPFEPVAADVEFAVGEADPVAFGSSFLSGPPTAPALSPVGEIEEPEMTESFTAGPPSFARPAQNPHRQEFVAASSAPPSIPAPLVQGEPGIADLVARFARALEGHRAAQAAPIADEAPAPADVPQAFDEIEPASEPEAAAAPSAFAAAGEPPVPHIPLALRPIGFEDEDADEGEDALPDLDLTAALSSGSRPFAAPSLAEESPREPVSFGDVEEVVDEEPSEDAYSSLLAMKSPFGLAREQVRIDEDDEPAEIEPVVVFPGQAVRRAVPAADGPARDAVAHIAAARPFDAPALRAESVASGGTIAPGAARADSGETERALREALDKLQKMSGLG